MDFGVLDGLMSSENKNTLSSSCDLDLKTKWFGSNGGFCKQESYVSPTTNEGEWRDLKMAKVSENGHISKTMLQQQQQQQHRSSCGQNMLSFSSPNTQSVTFPYYARNNTGYGAGGLFTPSQWMELEHQALIYKYITANAAIPSNLLIPIKKALESAAFSAYSGHFRQNTYGWGALHLGFCNSTDPEPGRCRRTDGKKWRCAKDAVPDQKYCERHMNRGRHRSRKPVEAQSSHSLSSNTVVGVAKLTGSAIHSTTPNPVGSSLHNRKANMEANGVPMLSSSSLSLKKNQHSTPKEVSNTIEFGLVCSDSLVNPMHKSDSRSQNPLHQFMEDWPHSNRAPAPAPAPSERQDLSSLRMGLGMSIQVNRVPGGPLGEALQKSKNNSPTGLNMMTEQLGPTSHKMQLGYLL